MKVYSLGKSIVIETPNPVERFSINEARMLILQINKAVIEAEEFKEIFRDGNMSHIRVFIESI